MAKMAQALVRSALLHQSLSFLLPKRLVSSTTITRIASISTSLLCRRSVKPLTDVLRSVQLGQTADRFAIRLNRSGYSSHEPQKSRSNLSELPPSEMPLLPGCDYKHWMIVMDKPGGEGADKNKMIDCYVETLAIVLGSKEEAKHKIYNVSFEKYFGFGCQIDKETSNKLKGLPGIRYVLPDCYVDPENKDYGAELYVNGQIVERSPERQRRVVESQHQQKRDLPQYKQKRDLPQDNGAIRNLLAHMSQS